MRSLRCSHETCATIRLDRAGGRGAAMPLTVSVIVCAHNEARCIATALQRRRRAAHGGAQRAVQDGRVDRGADDAGGGAFLVGDPGRGRLVVHSPQGARGRGRARRPWRALRPAARVRGPRGQHQQLPAEHAERRRGSARRGVPQAHLARLRRLDRQLADPHRGAGRAAGVAAQHRHEQHRAAPRHRVAARRRHAHGHPRRLRHLLHARPGRRVQLSGTCPSGAIARSGRPCPPRWTPWSAAGRCRA